MAGSSSSVTREANGSSVRYVVSGRFDAASAWEMSTNLDSETNSEVVLDFSQVNEFVDYGVAVVANAILALPRKHVHMRGLRQHQARLFKYFGVDPEELASRSDVPPAVLLGLQPPASKVA